MGREVQYPILPEWNRNVSELLDRVNGILSQYPEQPLTVVVNSGYRPGHWNTQAGGSPRSAHLTCEAVDIADPGGILARWLLGNLSLLEQYNLYLEDPSRTPSWIHLQTRPTRSGKRVFLP